AALSLEDVTEVDVHPGALGARRVVDEQDRGLVPGKPQPAALSAVPARDRQATHPVVDAPHAEEWNETDREVLIERAHLPEHPPHLGGRERRDRRDEAILPVATQRAKAAHARRGSIR